MREKTCVGCGFFGFFINISIPFFIRAAGHILEAILTPNSSNSVCWNHQCLLRSPRCLTTFGDKAPKNLTKRGVNRKIIKFLKSQYISQIVSDRYGATENAEVVNAIRSKLQGWKKQE